MRKRSWLIALAATAVFALIIFCVVSITKGSDRKKMKIENFHAEALGENVYLFKESDDHAAIQAVIDEIYERQETNQFGNERYALCFFPGDYSDITVNVGFYTQVLGLGMNPTDVKIGELTCSAKWLGDDNNHNATQNFWRSVENIEVLSNTMWAVSQATDMRRVQIDGALHLHDNYGWASGGFLSDSRILSMVDSGSQQQWLSRTNQYRTWMNENWNIVFVGDEPSGLPTGTWPVKAYTAVEKTEEIQDKPLLMWPDPTNTKQPAIMIPNRRTGAVGISWASADDIDYKNIGWDNESAREYASKISPAVNTDLPTFPQELGSISSLDEWYIAFPDKDNAATLTNAANEGKNLLFTPGVYSLDEPVCVGDDTILLGLGLASLRACAGNELVKTSGSNISLFGLLFDAGPAVTDASGQKKVSENLLYIGKGESICLSDVYFRVGGTPTDKPAVAECCVTIDADKVIGENLWVWRADHGDEVAWDKNVTRNGIVINGNDVLMYALMVEHFHEYQTVWNGEGGRLYMYQSEVPYDVPANDVWMSRDGKRAGFASLFVNDDVKSFKGVGLGIYLYNRDNPVLLESAVEMPDTEGVSIHHIITVMLSGNPGMKHVINDVGEAVMTPGAEAIILDYTDKIFK